MIVSGDTPCLENKWNCDEQFRDRDPCLLPILENAMTEVPAKKFEVGQKVRVIKSGKHLRVQVGDVLTISDATLIAPIVMNGVQCGTANWCYSFEEPYGSLFEHRLESVD
jgi:hypothetical protein